MTNARNATHRTMVARRGAGYLLVLGVTTLVGVLATSALVVVRSQSKAGQSSCDAAQARHNALSGIETARVWIRKDTTWRSDFSDGTWVTNLSLATGSVTIEARDPVDNSIADGQHDGITLTATGVANQAVQKVTASLVAKPIPLPALAYAAHTGGQLHIMAGGTLNCNGATISTNGNLRNDNLINGGISVGGVEKLGTVNGTPQVTSASAKILPSATIADNYAALGVQCGNIKTINNVVMGPSLNPYGATNTQYGVYVFQPTSDMTIKASRFYGTFVIYCASGKKVTISDTVLIHPARNDFPTLIIVGDAEFFYDSANTTLSEAVKLTNFNPPQVPYLGLSDVTTLGTYPSELQGLIHVTGKVSVKATARIRGVLLAGSTANGDALKFDQSPELIYTPSLFSNPPQWYTTDVPMPLLPGSFGQPSL